MDVSVRNVERENEEMHESLRDLEAENKYLQDKIILLKKALEKEKKIIESLPTTSQRLKRLEMQISKKRNANM